MSPDTAAIILGGRHVWNEDAFAALGPRLLLPVANAPLVHYTLAWLRDGGVSRATLCTNRAVSLLHAFLGAGQEHACELYYCVDRLPRGPAGSCDCLRSPRGKGMPMRKP